jgi:hypothetical protein
VHTEPCMSVAGPIEVVDGVAVRAAAAHRSLRAPITLPAWKDQRSLTRLAVPGSVAGEQRPESRPTPSKRHDCHDRRQVNGRRATCGYTRSCYSQPAQHGPFDLTKDAEVWSCCGEW